MSIPIEKRLIDYYKYKPAIVDPKRIIENNISEGR